MSKDGTFTSVGTGSRSLPVISKAAVIILVKVTSLAVSCCSTGATAGFINVPTPPPIPVTIYELPGCTCCAKYMPYLESFGFKITANFTMDESIRKKYPVPPEMVSCHIMIIDGYFVEGHVPVEAIRKLLKERPAVDGIILPGMQDGSPGMDGKQTRPFYIYAVTAGKTSQFLAFPVP